MKKPAYTPPMDTATTHRRKTSIYTIRMGNPTPGKILKASDGLPHTQDQGEHSVSWRSQDDATALLEAETAMAGIDTPWSLETGLGIHRRIVTILNPRR